MTQYRDNDTLPSLILSPVHQTEGRDTALDITVVNPLQIELVIPLVVDVMGS